MNMLRLAIDLPDLWQQEAVRALREGHDVIVDAPTGAGKTRVFELLMEGEAGRFKGQAVYTVPTRALANDKWREWKTRGWKAGIATGDISHNLDATVLVATLETQRERILAGNAPRLLVIDEYQMIADARRGVNYELAIAFPPPTTQLLMLSGSVRNPQDVAAWLKRLGRDPVLIRVDQRPVPLDEFPIERLPRVPSGIAGFWGRLGAGAVLAGLSPLLIFAPRRAEAEKIAKRVAEALPLDNPIPISPEQERFLGKDLIKLLQHRVAYHHSGLPYAARAGFIEPLAKNGHLRVIVATTGLSAGINFSVRSVLVSSTTYQDGPFTRELAPDELLQMFGRAGRRGLDEWGHVLIAQNTPRLHDAAPRQLRRTNQVDWPTLVRIMEHTSSQGGDIFAKVTETCDRLFSKQTIRLGFESSTDAPDAPSVYGPTREEFLNSRNEWQIRKKGAEVVKHLLDCLAQRGQDWLPALRVPSIVERFGPGRLCKLSKGRGFQYGKELTVGMFREDGLIHPAGWVKKTLHLKPGETFSETEFLESAVPLLATEWKGARGLQIIRRGEAAALQISVDTVKVKATPDEAGAFLLNPPHRRVAVQRETTYSEARGSILNPPAGSAARAWRTLGLVEADGTPSARGRIFNRFQAGEGLMIAAALEDAHYPASEIVCHLANLRGGHRFGELGGAESDHLAIACRAAYGHVDYEGYLAAGIAPGYGEGTWEAIDRFFAGGMRSLSDTGILRGDLERAILEWQSLLRHIVHAPDPDVPRWAELREAAAEAVRRPVEQTMPDWSVQLPPVYLQPKVDYKQAPQFERR